MTGQTAAGLGRRLRRLDRAGLARFVAALWAVSGWSTSVRDGRVVARRRAPESDRLDIAVVGGGAGATRTLVEGHGEADRLVAPVGERTARALAARTGTEVVGAAALEERLTYAVEADARERLLEEFVPDPRRTPSRRAMLSALAGGTGLLGAAAAAGVGAGGNAVATVVAALEGSGDPVAPGTATADGAAEETSTSPHTRTPTAAEAASADGCDDARTFVGKQLLGMMESVALGAGSDGDGDGEVEYPRPETTDAFRAAVEAAGADPIRFAVSADVGTALESDGEVTVPVTVATPHATVLYRITLRRAEGRCWRTLAAERIASHDDDG